MVRFWNTIAAWFSRSRVVDSNHYGTVLACGGCAAEVVLDHFHWGHPSPHEDITFWRCPPCVNKHRKHKGLAPLGKDGRPIHN